ncbi:hypothetical protein [Sporohalobacter salinus]|uniref:hypothetical protein n=1 Tax=Sporohalobacter salinus TaxID=1494606 RepID=UPI00196121A2|nr:hypothetical protein [Sporohalobacter salinus]MBM7624077.1 hypothetical protein [Sporohalobacter salinus]
MEACKKNGSTQAFIIIIITVLILFNSHSIGLAKSNIVNLIKHESVVVTADQVVENVIVVGGKVTIAGTVKEDVVVLGGNLEIKSSAVIGGNIGVIGGKIDQSSQAIVTENIFNLELSPSDFDILLIGILIFLSFMFVKYLVAIVLLLTTILFNYFLPRQIKEIARVINEESFKASLLGIFSSILFGLLIVISAITIIGSSISILILCLVLIGAIIGLNGFAYLVGKQLTEVLTIEINKDLTTGILGICSLILLWFIPIVGSILFLLFFLLSFGAIIFRILVLE